MRYTVYSKGLHSNWLLNHQDSSLFDCGEGCATELGYLVFVPDKLFLTHSHIDHIAGLPSFLGLRNSTKGANDKELTIYYPQGNKRIEDWITFSHSLNRNLKYTLNIHPMTQGERIEIHPKKGAREWHYIEAFTVDHGRENSLGYRAVTKSHRMKQEFRGKPKEFYVALSAQQKEDMQEETIRNRFFYSGDGMPPRSDATSPLNGAEVAFMDCTFLKSEDRDNPTHACIEEWVEKCETAGVKKGYAMHLSIRYSDREVHKRIEELKERFQMNLIPCGQLVNIE